MIVFIPIYYIEYYIESMIYELMEVINKTK